MSQYKPCPFCGEKENFSMPRDPYRVRCEKCKAQGPTIYEKQEPPMDRWNKRTESQGDIGVSEGEK